MSPMMSPKYPTIRNIDFIIIINYVSFVSCWCQVYQIFHIFCNHEANAVETNSKIKL